MFVPAHYRLGRRLETIFVEGLVSIPMHLDRDWISIVALSVALLVIGILGWRESIAFLNANEGAISGILSLLLVILYYKQYQLQNQQISLRNRPHIEIEKRESDRREMEIWLSNPGNGLIKDLEIATRVDFPPNADVSPSTRSYRLRRVDEEGNKKKRIGNALEAGEHKVRFIAEPHIELIIDGEKRGFGLLAATDELYHRDIEEAEIEFFVRGTDLLGNEYRERIVGGSYLVEIDEVGLDLQDILHSRIQLAQK